MNNDLEKLKKLYPDAESQEDIVNFEKELKKSGLMLNLLQHDGFKIFVTKFESELERINKSLQTDLSLFENEEGKFKGKLLHARKQWIKDFLKVFQGAKVEHDYTVHKITSLLTPPEYE